MIDVVVPNWNGKAFLQTCLDSLQRQTFRDFEVIVVDNGSRDGSVEFVKSNYLAVRAISFPENRGFSAAVNAGIAASSGDFIALLNNDTEAHPDWLVELYDALMDDPSAGFCASLMVDFHDRTVVDSAGNRYTRGGIAYRIGKGQPVSHFTERRYVFGACAGAAIYRRAMLEDIGCFDEDFFALYEDVDLDLRAHLMGYKCMFVPTAVVYHMGGATTGGHTPLTAQLNARNSLWVQVKNLPTELWLKYLPRILWVRQKAWRSYQKKKLGATYAQGLLQAMTGMRRMLVKRREIQRRRVISPSELDSWIE